VRRGPVPPASMRSEEVLLARGDTSLPATVVLPTARGPHPAVVLIHGSGPGPRAALLPLAAQFAAQGIAALVYDKRAAPVVGGSEVVSGETLAADAAAGVSLLRDRGDILADRIGLWGGSQGGTVAALAASRIPSVAFVVSVSGGGTPYTPFVMYQTARRLRAAGHQDSVIAVAVHAVRMRHDYLRGVVDAAALRTALDAVPQALAARGVPVTIPSEAERRVWRAAGLLEGDPAPIWEAVPVPVLALWGERDQLVPPRESAVAVQRALSRGASRRLTTVCVAPSADHGMLLPSGPGAGADGTFQFAGLAPAYRIAMFAWVREVVGLGPAHSGTRALREAGCLDPATLPPDRDYPR